MAPEPLRAALRLALVILGLALVTFPFQPAGSAAQVVTILAALVGALFVAAVALLARLSSGTPPALSRGDDPPTSAFNGRPHPQQREKEGSP